MDTMPDTWRQTICDPTEFHATANIIAVHIRAEITHHIARLNSRCPLAILFL